MLRTLAKRPPVARPRGLDNTMFSPVQRRSVSENTIVHPEDKNLIPIKTNLRGKLPLRCRLTSGSALLNNPRLNKGAGFNREERQIFALEGFLPYDVHSLERQCERAWNQLLKVGYAEGTAEGSNRPSS